MANPFDGLKVGIAQALINEFDKVLCGGTSEILAALNNNGYDKDKLYHWTVPLNTYLDPSFSKGNLPKIKNVSMSNNIFHIIGTVYNSSSRDNARDCLGLYWVKDDPVGWNKGEILLIGFDPQPVIPPGSHDFEIKLTVPDSNR